MNILPINNSIVNSVTYVLYREDVDYCVLIDCGEWGTRKPVIERIGKKVKAVLLTHGHSIISMVLLVYCRSIRKLKSIRLNTGIWNCKVIVKTCHSTMATLLL